jgi:hypothetical protein
MRMSEVGASLSSPTSAGRGSCQRISCRQRRSAASGQSSRGSLDTRRLCARHVRDRSSATWVEKSQGPYIRIDRLRPIGHLRSSTLTAADLWFGANPLWQHLLRGTPGVRGMEFPVYVAAPGLPPQNRTTQQRAPNATALSTGPIDGSSRLTTRSHQIAPPPRGRSKAVNLARAAAAARAFYPPPRGFSPHEAVPQVLGNDIIAN